MSERTYLVKVIESRAYEVVVRAASEAEAEAEARRIVEDADLVDDELGEAEIVGLEVEEVEVIHEGR